MDKKVIVILLISVLVLSLVGVAYADHNLFHRFFSSKRVSSCTSNNQCGDGKVCVFKRCVNLVTDRSERPRSSPDARPSGGNGLLPSYVQTLRGTRPTGSGTSIDRAILDGRTRRGYFYCDVPSYNLGSCRSRTRSYLYTHPVDCYIGGMSMSIFEVPSWGCSPRTSTNGNNYIQCEVNMVDCRINEECVLGTERIYEFSEVIKDLRSIDNQAVPDQTNMNVIRIKALNSSDNGFVYGKYGAPFVTDSLYIAMNDTMIGVWREERGGSDLLPVVLNNSIGFRIRTLNNFARLKYGNTEIPLNLTFGHRYRLIVDEIMGIISKSVNDGNLPYNMGFYNVSANALALDATSSRRFNIDCS